MDQHLNFKVAFEALLALVSLLFMGADLYGIPLIIIHMGFREKFGSGPGAQKRDTRDTRILQWT